MTCLSRFLSDRRGRAPVDHAMAAALLVAVQQLGGAHAAQLSALLRPLFPA